jgi:hypothetical protein
MMPLTVPAAVPSEVSDLQANPAGGQRFAPFGGRDGLVCLFCRGEKYCHNGGLAFAYGTAVGHGLAAILLAAERSSEDALTAPGVLSRPGVNWRLGTSREDFFQCL